MLDCSHYVGRLFRIAFTDCRGVQGITRTANRDYCRRLMLGIAQYVMPFVVIAALLVAVIECYVYLDDRHTAAVETGSASNASDAAARTAGIAFVFAMAGVCYVVIVALIGTCGTMTRSASNAGVLSHVDALRIFYFISVGLFVAPVPMVYHNYQSDTPSNEQYTALAVLAPWISLAGMWTCIITNYACVSCSLCAGECDEHVCSPWPSVNDNAALTVFGLGGLFFAVDIFVWLCIIAVRIDAEDRPDAALHDASWVSLMSPLFIFHGQHWCTSMALFCFEDDWDDDGDISDENVMKESGQCAIAIVTLTHLLCLWAESVAAITLNEWSAAKRALDVTAANAASVSALTIPKQLLAVLILVSLCLPVCVRTMVILSKKNDVRGGPWLE